MTTSAKARYEFEHKLLPWFLFQEKSEFISTIMKEREDIIHSLWDFFIYRRTGEQYPYSESDITFVPRIYMNGDDSRMIIRIGMPTPLSNLLCRYVYLCYDSKTGSIAYFTSERSVSAMIPYMLCGWSPNGMHLNYGQAPVDPEDEFEMVIQIFSTAIKDQDELIIC